MKRILVVFYLLICSGLVEAQHIGEAVKKEKTPFEIGFAVESLYRDFSRGSFLGDSYQMGIGYRLMTRFGFRGYPGLGVYAGRQQVTVAENRFLGDFFDQARTGDSGFFVYYDVPVVDKLFVSTNIGVGHVSMVHGEGMGRFKLDYRHYFGSVGAKYVLVEKQNWHRMSLTLNLGSGWYLGNQIRINLLDREYMRRATDIQLSVGVLVDLF